MEQMLVCGWGQPHAFQVALLCIIMYVVCLSVCLLCEVHRKRCLLVRTTTTGVSNVMRTYTRVSRAIQTHI